MSARKNPRTGFNPDAKKVGDRAKVTAVILPRATWHLRCKGGLFVLTAPFFTRKEARGDHIACCECECHEVERPEGDDEPESSERSPTPVAA